MIRNTGLKTGWATRSATLATTDHRICGETTVINETQCTYTEFLQPINLKSRWTSVIEVTHGNVGAKR